MVQVQEPLVCHVQDLPIEVHVSCDVEPGAQTLLEMMRLGHDVLQSPGGWVSNRFHSLEIVRNRHKEAMERNVSTLSRISEERSPQRRLSISATSHYGRAQALRFLSQQSSQKPQHNQPIRQFSQ